MIKYKGRLKIKQFIQNKPIKYGIKCFILCDSCNSYALNLIIYTGKKDSNDKKSKLIGEEIVLSLVKKYKNLFKTVYFDNYYNTIKLDYKLTKLNIGFIGTLRKNRVKDKLNIIEKPKKNNTNFYIDNTKEIILAYIHDKKDFFLTTNLKIPTYDKKNNKSDISKEYNSNAKSVDLCNQYTTQYRYPHRNKKWYKPIVFHIFQIFVFNSFIIYKKILNDKNKELEYFEYYYKIVEKLIGVKREKNKNNFHTIEKMVSDGGNRIFGICKFCTKYKTNYKCQKCNAYLCLEKREKNEDNCFNLFHLN